MRTTQLSSQIPKKLFLYLSLGLWCGLVVIGLWPFNFSPRNRVQWLPGGNGIHFEPHGQIHTIDRLDLRRAESKAKTDSFSIEIWLQPDKPYSWVGTVLCIHDPKRADDFMIQQSGSDLVVRGRSHKQSKTELWIDNVFQERRNRFVTISSGPRSTIVYLDGAEEKLYPYTLEASDVAGWLLLGHSATAHNPWAGTIFGMAIYDRSLSGAEVERHFAAWRERKIADLASNSGVSVLYSFDEKTGDRIRNRAAFGPDLVVPERFHTLQEKILEFPSPPRTSGWSDIAFNILGFVPFGFLVSAYIEGSIHGTAFRALLLAVVFGAVTSLGIEIVQAYLPSRDSCLLDFINNVVGTTLGAMLLAVLNSYSHTCSESRQLA
jgi:hypothetical protein